MTTEPIRVMVVEDHNVVRQGLVALLSVVEGLTVVGEAADGHEALKQYQATRPDITLIDLRMPKMDGHHFARSIKAESPRTPIIMMTGWDVTMRNDGETAPEVDAVIGKPPHMQELNNLILRVTTQVKPSP